MRSHFDVQHWNRVKQARAERGLNRIPPELMRRPNHWLAGATLRHRLSGNQWTVLDVREDWHLGRYLTATLECEGATRVCVVELISSEDPTLHQQLDAFNAEFEVVAY